MSTRLIGLAMIAVALTVIVIAYLSGGLAKDSLFDNSGPVLVHHAAWVTVLLGALIAARPSLGEVFKAIVGWGAIGLLLIAGYAYRAELQAVGNRTLSALVPGYVDTSDGEVSIFRNADGHFRVAGLVDGQSIGFMVDTGATQTTLSHGDAVALGIDVNGLNYSIPVSTANGRTLVAVTRLQRLDLAGVERQNLAVFVARPGGLRQSLLGMDFLDSLTSWRVEGDRLILVP